MPSVDGRVTGVCTFGFEGAPTEVLGFVDVRETCFASELLTADVFFFDDCEAVLDDLDVDVDLVGPDPAPSLLVCAKALDWNAVSANPSRATAIVVLSVFMMRRF